MLLCHFFAFRPIYPHPVHSVDSMTFISKISFFFFVIFFTLFYVGGRLIFTVMEFTVYRDSQVFGSQKENCTTPQTQRCALWIVQIASNKLNISLFIAIFLLWVWRSPFHPSSAFRSPAFTHGKDLHYTSQEIFLDIYN